MLIRHYLCCVMPLALRHPHPLCEDMNGLGEHICYIKDSSDNGVALPRSEKLVETLLTKNGFEAPWKEVQHYLKGSIGHGIPPKTVACREGPGIYL